MNNRSEQKVVALGKDLVASAAADYKEALRGAAAETDRVVLDLEGVQTIDSVGIELVIAAHKSMQKMGGCMALTHVSPSLQKLFEAMRLDQHFKIDTIN
jgi:anti-anti-sigma factor